MVFWSESLDPGARARGAITDVEAKGEEELSILGVALLAQGKVAEGKRTGFETIFLGIVDCSCIEEYLLPCSTETLGPDTFALEIGSETLPFSQVWSANSVKGFLASTDWSTSGESDHVRLGITDVMGDMGDEGVEFPL